MYVAIYLGATKNIYTLQKAQQTRMYLKTNKKAILAEHIRNKKIKELAIAIQYLIILK